MEQKIKFQKLTPTDEADLKIYEDGFEYIFNNEDIRNVAISGPYSAGKSSILESYKKKFPQKEFIHISLAHFKEENGKNSEDRKSIETVLEGKIINQLIQQIPVKNIPQTNFRVKQDIDWRICAINAGLIVLFILGFAGLLHFYDLKNWTDTLPDGRLSSVMRIIVTPYSRLIYSLLCIVIGGVATYQIVKLQKTKRVLKKLSVQGNDIEIFSDTEESYFDKYLNEVLYLFENTKADAIVFEDIDRFEIGAIFERLREINHLANWRLKKKGKNPIRFFYLLRDDIFINKDRTKFFDFILPIIPVVDSSNAFNKFKSYLGEGDIYNLFDEKFLRGLSLYIDDLRILKNIYNEFIVYYKKLNTIELDSNRMLAIITYKNIFPKDFTELQLNKGFVYSIFNKKEDFIKSELDKIDDEIQCMNEKIEKCNREHLKNNEELNVIYDNKIRNIYSRNRESLQKEKEERKQSIEDRKSNRIREYENRVQELEAKKEELVESELKKIITRDNIDAIFHIVIFDELGNEIKFEDIKQNEYFDLLKYLLRNGYIDETYNDYMSYFYENSLTRNDKMFLRSVTDKKAKGYDYKIDNVRLVLSNLEPIDFSQEETRNFTLFREILKNEENGVFLERFLKQLQKNECYEFLYKYLKIEVETDIFIKQMCERWPEFFYELLKKDSCSEIWIYEFCIEILKALDIERLNDINIDNCLREYISNNKEFLNIPNSSYENIIEKLIALQIKFIEIEENVSNELLLRLVYENNLYVLNMKNVYMFLKCYCEVEINDENEGKILTIIRMHGKELQQYVNVNLGEFLKVILERKSGITDSDETIIDVLNREDIEFCERQEYIEKLKGCIGKLKAINDKKLREYFIIKRKCEYTIDNIVTYYADNSLNKVLIEYINSSYKRISLIFESNDILEKFQIDCMACNDLADDKYQEMLTTINIKCERLGVTGLQETKMSILISNNLIKMNLENVLFIREKYSNLIMSFIEKNMKEYIGLVKESDLSPLEIEKMLEWEFSDDDKKYLLDKMENLRVSVLNKKISDELCSFILKNNFRKEESAELFKSYSKFGDKSRECIAKIAKDNIGLMIDKVDEVDRSLFDVIMYNQDVHRDERKRLFKAGMKNFSEEHCKRYLEWLEYSELVKIFENEEECRVDINVDNKEILEIMKKLGIVVKYEEDKENKVYIIRKRKEEEELPTELL